MYVCILFLIIMPLHSVRAKEIIEGWPMKVRGLVSNGVHEKKENESSKQQTSLVKFRKNISVCHLVFQEPCESVKRHQIFLKTAFKGLMSAKPF